MIPLGIATVVLIGVLAAAGQYWLKVSAREVAVSGPLSAPAVWPMLGAMVCYVAAFGLYVALLQWKAVSTLYPIAVGCTFVAVTLMAWLVLRESISPTTWAGIALVATGVALIQRG